MTEPKITTERLREIVAGRVLSADEFSGVRALARELLAARERIEGLEGEIAELRADALERAEEIAALIEIRSTLRADNLRLTRERDEARHFAEMAAKKHNDLLIETRIVTCIWCGFKYESGHEPDAAQLKEHAGVCEKSPLRAAERCVAELVRLGDRMRPYGPPLYAAEWDAAAHPKEKPKP